MKKPNESLQERMRKEELFRLEAQIQINQWFIKHGDKLFFIALSKLRNPDDAEDVVYALKLKLLTVSFRAVLKVKDIEAYLVRAIINASLDAIKMRDRRRRNEIPMADLDSIEIEIDDYMDDAEDIEF